MTGTMRYFQFLIVLGLLGQSCSAYGQAPSDAGTVRILQPNAAPDVVWSHARQACDATDIPDVPARPFLGDGGRRVLWFASAAPNYFATLGTKAASGEDILARMERRRGPDGNCVTWVEPAPYASALGVPQSYDTGLWLQSVFTPDGRRVFALVHNEFHGELTAPPGEPSIYCTITQSFFLAGNACSYWNMAGAASRDGGWHFRLYKIGGAGEDADYNAPVLALPRPYLLPADNGGNNPGLSGLVTVSNIVRRGRYHYVLVQQVPAAAPVQDPSQPQPIGRNGTCIYRTDRLFDRTSWRGWNGAAYAAPNVTSYPSDLADPARYTCIPVLNGMYRFSWSYNTVLDAFIVMGIDTKFGPQQIEAFVYTTVVLGEDGRLVQTSGEHFLREINWFDRWSSDTSLTGEAYPSLLDPTSPEISRGDFSFQYSGAHPYLYYTLLHPIGASGDHNNRDVVRQQLVVTPE
jgi:hypothetical protein